MRAERLRRGRNDTKGGAVSQHKAICRRRTIAVDASRLDGAEADRQLLQDLLARDHLAHRPLRGPTNVHVFDKAHLSAGFTAEVHQIGQFVIIESAHHYGVDLEALEPGLTRGPNALQDLS